MNPSQHPAETVSGAGAVALVVAYAAGIHDAGVITALGVTIGLIPGAITWAVTTFRKAGKS